MPLRFAACAGLACLVASVAGAQTAPASEDERRLDKVIVPGAQFDLRYRIPKGEMTFSPELVVNINGEKGRSALHDYYELVFDPVIVLDNGFIVPDPDPRRKREKLRPTLTNTRNEAPLGSNIVPRARGSYTLRLEEGTYALTNVEYRALTKPLPFVNAALLTDGLLLEQSWEVHSYCLAGGTLVFDVKAGEEVTYGRVLFKGLYKKPFRAIRELKPIAASENPATRPSDGFFFNRDPEPAAWAVGRFDEDVGLCLRNTDFVTSGWPISDEWEW